MPTCVCSCARMEPAAGPFIVARPTRRPPSPFDTTDAVSGFCGIVHWNEAPVEADALRAMIDAAAHRGPDGVDTWRRGQVGMAHLALDVTPESVREDPPIVDTEAGLVLVADARIDNRAALQRALRGTLRTAAPTDADLALAAYRRWGVDCAAHLIGDFALAIWDERERRLFAARDPMAMRPFYYRVAPHRFLFGSEVKQILAAPDVPARLFEPAVAAHLAGRFEALDETFYEGIRQLEPAHALVVRADGTHRTWRYWDVDPDARIRYDDERDYVAHFRTLFAEAVRCRLRSPKPVGLFLSGGLDSGSIASMAGHLKETEGLGCPDVRTYSWAFPTLTQCDERSVSDRIVERYDLPATYIDAEAVTLIGPPDGVPDRDEPFMGKYQALLVEGLRQAQSEGVRQVMTGRSGDLLVGMWLFDNLGLLREGQWHLLWKELQAQKAELEVPLRNLVHHFIYRPIRTSVWPKGKAEWLRRPLKRVWYALRPAAAPSPSYPPWVTEAVRRRVALPPKRLHEPSNLHDHTRRERYRAITLPLQHRASIWFERLCSRYHIKAVDPWTDRRLVQFVMAIPQREVCQQGKNKYLAWQAMKGIMPEHVRLHAQKVSPKPLLVQALKDEQRREILAYTSTSHAGVHRYVDVQKLKAYYQRYCRDGEEDLRFWEALSLVLWLHELDDWASGFDDFLTSTR